MEKRRLQRTKIYHPGKVFLLGETMLDCTVLNITGFGACIELIFPIQELPETLEFSFDNFRTIHRCKIIWREGNHAGFAFEELPWPSISHHGRRASLRVVKRMSSLHGEDVV